MKAASQAEREGACFALTGGLSQFAWSRTATSSHQESRPDEQRQIAPTVGNVGPERQVGVGSFRPVLGVEVATLIVERMAARLKCEPSAGRASKNGLALLASERHSAIAQDTE